MALTAGFSWQVLLQGYHLPSGECELAVFIYLRNSFPADQIPVGSSPLWRPHLYAGEPYLARRNHCPRIQGEPAIVGQSHNGREQRDIEDRGHR